MTKQNQARKVDTAHKAARTRKGSKARRAQRKRKQLLNMLAATACLLVLLGGGAWLITSALAPKARPAAPQVEVAAPPIQADYNTLNEPQLAIPHPTDAPTAAPRV